MRSLLFIFFLIVGGLIGYHYYREAQPQDLKLEYGTIVQEPKIAEIVAATGTAEPMEVRVVESELPGVLAEVLVDFNQEVKQGQPLAKLMSDTQQMKLQQAESMLHSANLAIESAQTQIEQARDARQYAQAALDRQQDRVRNAQGSGITPGQSIADLQLLANELQARLAQSDSQIKQAQVGLKSAQQQRENALLAIAAAKLELQKTVLESTLQGFVLSKNAHIGDAVGRPKLSLDASGPLFEIAAPLDQMRAIVKISEDAYGKVRLKQKVELRFDAYPEEVFLGEVTQIRNKPILDRTTTAVQYPVVVEFSNRKAPTGGQWMIKPGATVEADIVLREVHDVTALPRLATLYTPQHRQAGIEIPTIAEDEVLVWKLGADKKPQPIKVKVGIGSDDFLQVLDDSVQVGDQLIISEPVEPRRTFRLPIGG